MSEFTFGFKITKYPSIAEIVKIIRRYRPFSVSEIKDKVEKGDFIFEVDSCDDAQCRELLECIQELAKSKIAVQLYDTLKLPADLQLLKNWLQTCRETAYETDAESILEADEYDSGKLEPYSRLWTDEQADWVVVIRNPEDDCLFDYAVFNRRTREYLEVEEDADSEEYLIAQIAARMIMEGNEVTEDIGKI